MWHRTHFSIVSDALLWFSPSFLSLSLHPLFFISPSSSLSSSFIIHSLFLTFLLVYNYYTRIHWISQVGLRSSLTTSSLLRCLSLPATMTDWSVKLIRSHPSRLLRGPEMTLPLIPASPGTPSRTSRKANGFQQKSQYLKSCSRIVLCSLVKWQILGVFLKPMCRSVSDWESNVSV